MNIFHAAREADAPLINSVSAKLGKGNNNLSIKLVDKDGNIYLSCHSSAWTKEDYEIFKQRKGFSDFCTKEELAALDRLLEHAIDDYPEYIAIEYIDQKLQEWGLSIVQEEIDIK